MKDFKKIMLIIGVIIFSLGMFFLFMAIFSFEVLNHIICIFIGILIILVCILPIIILIEKISFDKMHIIDLILTIGLIITAIVFFPIHNMGMSIALGSYLIVLPVVRIIINDNKLQTFKENIMFIIIGALLFFKIAEPTFQVAVIAISGVMILLSIIMIIQSLIPSSKRNGIVINAKVDEIESSNLLN